MPRAVCQLLTLTEWLPRLASARPCRGGGRYGLRAGCAGTVPDALCEVQRPQQRQACRGCTPCGLLGPCRGGACRIASVRYHALVVAWSSICIVVSVCVCVCLCVCVCYHAATMCSHGPSPGTACSRSPSRSRSWLRTAPPMATQSWLASAWMPPWVLAWSCTHAQSRSSRRHSSRPVTLMAHWRCSSTQGEWLPC